MTSQPKPVVAFVLGAGASADFGAPTMAQFLAAASQHASEQDLQEVVGWREKAVQRGALALDAGETGAPDANNLEDIFSLLDMESQFFHAGMREMVGALKRIVAAVYARSVRDNVNAALGRMWNGDQPQVGYEALVQRLRALSEGTLWNRGCSFVTTNYDCALDILLAHIPAFGLSAVYGHPSWSRTDANEQRLAQAAWYPLYWLGRHTDEEMQYKVPRVLKLHGSVNWGLCKDPECDAPVRQFAIFSRRGSQAPQWLDCVDQMAKDPCQYHAAEDEEDCGHRPFIVPPSWKRQPHNYALRRIWVRAHRDLFFASRVVIVGHSLAPTDAYLRHFLALSLTRRTDNRILVVGPEGPGLQRYKQFLQAVVPDRWAPRVGLFAEQVDNIVDFVSDVV